MQEALYPTAHGRVRMPRRGETLTVKEPYP